VESFVPSDSVKIETDPNANEPQDAQMTSDDATRIEELCAELDNLRQTLPEGYRVHPVSFEKDDDSNFHMDLITSLANMRARNYGIPEA
jgi:ubiquitin-activating enzyme E1